MGQDWTDTLDARNRGEHEGFRNPNVSDEELVQLEAERALAEGPHGAQRSEPAAGWYDDPEDARLLRRWDGTSWTDERAHKG